MAYVKLDTGILDSTLWGNRDERDVFLTALLMALPHEIATPTPALDVRTMEPLGWDVPVGWYGLVGAAGIGIIRRSGIEDVFGMEALVRLGQPDLESRTADFEGRRVVRISGGFLVLNFMRYRDRDTTAAERMKRYRERQKMDKGAPKSDTVHRHGHDVTNTNVTQAVSSKQEAVSRKQEAGKAEAAAGAATTAIEVALSSDAGDPTTDPAVQAYRHYREKARMPEAFDAQLQMLRHGVGASGGRSVPWSVLGRALHEMLVADAKLTPATLRAFVKRLQDDPGSRPLDTTPLAHGSF